MNLKLHPEALAEFQDAAEYLNDRQPDLGMRFVGMVETAFTQIGNAPYRWRILEGDVRRCLVHTFPYAILYSVEPDIILVLAVMHCHREPGYWRQRVSDKGSNS